jgi:hypothetical protein
MPKQNPQQPTTQLRSSKQKANQQSAPLTTLASTMEKAKKSKAAESAASLLSLPPASTPEGVKHSKLKPVEVALTVVPPPPPPPPPAEVAKLTSPVVTPESSKDFIDAAKSSVGGIASVSVGISANTVSVNDVVTMAAVADREESTEEEGSGDEGSSSKGSGSSGEEEEQYEEENVLESEEDDAHEDDGSNDDDEYLPEEDILVGGKDEEVEELDNKPSACKSKPVQKSVPEKFVAARKKKLLLTRSQ